MNLSGLMPLMPHMKKPDQILDIGFVGADADAIHINGSQHIPQLIKTQGTGTAVLISKGPAGGIDENCLARLRIREFDEPHIGQGHLRKIPN